MIFPAVIIVSAAMLLAGCQGGAAQPANGLSTVRIAVRAEPKQGVRPPSAAVAVYDKPSSPQYGAFERVDYASLDNVVVWVAPMSAGLPTTAPSPAGPAVRAAITDHATAEPPVTGIGVGQELVLVNRGGRAMNLYSVSDGNDFDLGVVPPGGEARYRVRSAGLIEVLTDSFEQPVARVYAAPTPWVRVARAGEEVTFSNLPPGRYRVASWHPRLPGSETTADLPPNEIRSVSISVGVNALPKEYAK